MMCSTWDAMARARKRSAKGTLGARAEHDRWDGGGYRRPARRNAHHMSSPMSSSSSMLPSSPLGSSARAEACTVCMRVCVARWVYTVQQRHAHRPPPPPQNHLATLRAHPRRQCPPALPGAPLACRPQACCAATRGWPCAAVSGTCAQTGKRCVCRRSACPPRGRATMGHHPGACAQQARSLTM